MKVATIAAAMFIVATPRGNKNEDCCSTRRCSDHRGNIGGFCCDSAGHYEEKTTNIYGKPITITRGIAFAWAVRRQRSFVDDANMPGVLPGATS